MNFADCVVYSSMAFVGYTYILYPVLVCSLSRIFGRESEGRKEWLPSVSIVISAYRPGSTIKNKLVSIMDLDYPKEKLEVLIGLDGPDEEAEEVLTGFSSIFPSLKVLRCDKRRGKPAVLNDLLSEAKGEVLVFTDARQPLHPHSVRKLVEVLGDPSVGAVSGELVFLDDEGMVKGDIGLYWKYEKKIRACESRLYSMIGVTGALYAMRREFVRPLPEDIILDDLWQPFNALREGKRIVFLPGAVVYDWVSEDEWREFQRKVRTLVGNYQLIAKDQFFLSFKNPIFWQFLSHKIFRLFVPYAMVICYLGSIFMSWPWNAMLFSAQTGFYLMAALRMLGIGRGRVWSFPYTFVLLNLAGVVALYRFLKGRYSVKW